MSYYELYKKYVSILIKYEKLKKENERLKSVVDKEFWKDEL